MANVVRQTASPWPAWLDITQSGSGLLLGVFLWAHMFFVSSILISKDAMYFVARMFEGEPFFGKGYPMLVSGFALAITALIALHAILALRKFPSNYRQYSAFTRQLAGFRHPDSVLWWLQVITGFLLFFLASVHLYQLVMHPDAIGPYASSDRVWTGRMWPLYLVLLFTVELHSGIGMYRLAVKWGWFMGKNPTVTRHRLQRIKWALTGFFLILGVVTLAAYMRIGALHEDQAGERYHPDPIKKPVFIPGVPA